MGHIQRISMPPRRPGMAPDPHLSSENTILDAHARDEEDGLRRCADHKLTARPIALQAFEKWLTQRAWAYSDTVLRSATKAVVTSATNDKMRVAPKTRAGVSPMQNPQKEAEEDSRIYLHQGENWNCHWCKRRFEGSLQARPPKRAPNT